MTDSTWWSIEIHHTELKKDPNVADGLLLPISIQLDLPINRSPIAKKPIDPIEVEKIFLWNRSENEYVSKRQFSKDDSAWETMDERAQRAFACTLCIPNKHCFREPFKTLEDALSIEVYDTTSGHTPWCYPVARLTAPNMSSIYIKINH